MEWAVWAVWASKGSVSVIARRFVDRRGNPVFYFFWITTSALGPPRNDGIHETKLLIRDQEKEIDPN
jgi:hypothetical protein